MPYDSAMMRATLLDASIKLEGTRVEKVYQPEKAEIDLLFRAPRAQFTLVLSATPGAPRVSLTNRSRENPAVPPMFCTLLRKHLTGARFIDCTQVGFDRIACIRFLSRDEMGEESEKYLYVETMGKYANIVLVNDKNKIIGVLKPVDFSDSQIRQLLPGMDYSDMPTADRRNPLGETREAFEESFSAFPRERQADKFFTSTYMGFSPLVAREMVYRACGDAERECFLCDCSALWREFSRMIGIISGGGFTPGIISVDNKMSDYSFTPISQYGEGAWSECGSFAELFDTFYGERERLEHIRVRGADLTKLTTNAIARIRKKIAKQEAELTECAERDAYKRNGDLISSNMWKLERGMTSVRLVDYSDPEMKEVEITLDRTLSPSANAQKWYKKYTKARNAQVYLTEQLAHSRAELAYIESVADTLSRAETGEDLDEIRRELYESGYASKLKGYRPKKQSAPKVMRFRTDGGYDVCVGRNNIQNEYVTFKLAAKSDWWFHVKGAPGSHVVLLCRDGEEPSADDFTQAAVIAAYYSSKRDGEAVAVDYTKIKNVKKPPAAHPGFVIFNTNYSCYVTPDKETVERLKVK